VSGTEIREAAAGAAATVTALWHQAGLTRPWNDPTADFLRAVEGPSSAVLLAEAGETLLGSVMVGHDGHRGWVYYLAVSPRCRRSGLGRRLMGAAEAWLAERRVPKIQLMVREDNSEALGFYQALGLEVQKVVVLGRFLDRP
jgi:ribosomal protein S18 acetylase RimI-like enzyme